VLDGGGERILLFLGRGVFSSRPTLLRWSGVFASVHHHDFDTTTPYGWAAGEGHVEDGGDHAGESLSDSGDVDADVSKMHDGAAAGKVLPAKHVALSMTQSKAPSVRTRPEATRSPATSRSLVWKMTPAKRCAPRWAPTVVVWNTAVPSGMAKKGHSDAFGGSRNGLGTVNC
jgi:hypothetical protein